MLGSRTQGAVALASPVLESAPPEDHAEDCVEDRAEDCAWTEATWCLQASLPTQSVQKTCFSLLPTELIASVTGSVASGEKEQL